MRSVYWSVVFLRTFSINENFLDYLILTFYLVLPGEICRYLLAQKETPEERQHNVTLVFGNGLRPKIWSEFVNRFNIKQVGEFYGSTEGNANISTIKNCRLFRLFFKLKSLFSFLSSQHR